MTNFDELEETLDQDADERVKAQRLSREVETLPRTQVPGYRLVRRVGRGSYGEVWKAVEQNTGREVAIKFFDQHRGLDWPLLKREVGKLAQVVSERRVVQLLEVGWESDPPYYVMEYLEGGSVADRLAEGPMAPRDAIRLFEQVVEGLTYLHGKAILHCDLKPANVLLDGRGEARLADFGQARLTSEAGPAGGTLFYLAPELARPGARPDARGDLYALGALLYTLLTGRAPYSDDRVDRELVGSSSADERLERYHELILRSPFPDAHRQISGIDGDLVAIIDRLLARDPEARFRSAHEVLDALEARNRRRAQRPLLAFGLLGPLALLIVVAAVGFVAFESAERQAQRALLEQHLEGDRAMAVITAAAVDRNLSAVQRRVEREAEGQRLKDRLVAHREGTREPPVLAQELQTTLDELYTSYQDRHFFSWVLADTGAVALARSPWDSGVIGHRYAYREWFSGQPETSAGHGSAMALGAIAAQAPEIRTSIGLTLAFESTAKAHPTLISVASPVSDETGHPLGVLAATLHLDTFNRWLASAEAAEGLAPDGCPERYIVLLHRDQVVRHPCPTSGKPMPPVERGDFFDRGSVRQLLREGESRSFTDPLIAQGPTRLAVVEKLESNPEWTLLLVHDRGVALAALGRLGSRLRLLGWVALSVGLAVVVLLGFLLFRVMRWQESG